MTMRFPGRAAMLGVILLGTTAMQPARAPLPLLDGLEPGRWELRGEGNAMIGAVCLGDPAQLVQVQHSGQNCRHLLLTADRRSLAVRYTCPGTGFGRTNILVETPRLARIDSQGIAGGVPFQMRLEARRTGPCR